MADQNNNKLCEYSALKEGKQNSPSFESWEVFVWISPAADPELKDCTNSPGLVLERKIKLLLPEAGVDSRQTG